MRLIDADALKELIVANVYPVADFFNSRDYGMFWTGGIEKAIDEQPTIDPVKHGRWVDESGGLYRCSWCGSVYGKLYDPENKLKYCPNCGSLMRRREKNVGTA